MTAAPLPLHPQVGEKSWGPPAAPPGAARDDTAMASPKHGLSRSCCHQRVERMTPVPDLAGAHGEAAWLWWI